MNSPHWYNHTEGIEAINTLGRERTPFLFILSYNKDKIFVQRLDALDDGIFYKMELWRNYGVNKREKSYKFLKSPLEFSQYKKAFDRVIEEIKAGNTYLLNLTFETAIESDLSLEEIFYYAQAKFKLNYKNQFICFSPERFIEIDGERLSTYPMKGTIEASLPQASDQILSNPKEMAEHIMIVDLMRNDLGIVADDVKVVDFRYIDQIKAGDKELLQVSSHIRATLATNWRDKIGDIIDALTPAGSITGTPKKKTREIIEEVEAYDRDFYTGIFGIFDAESLRSAVMIRFIEQRDGKLYYKSGGGVTIDSDAKSEYEEMVDKVYLPL